MEHALELLNRKVSLSQRIVVLEELAESHSVFFHHLFDLSHKSHNVRNSAEMSISCSVVRHLLVAFATRLRIRSIQKFLIADFSLVIAKHSDNGI